MHKPQTIAVSLLWSSLPPLPLAVTVCLSLLSSVLSSRSLCPSVLAASLDQAQLAVYALLDLQQDLGLPVVQLGQLVKVHNTRCELVDITVIHSG